MEKCILFLAREKLRVTSPVTLSLSNYANVNMSYLKKEPEHLCAIHISFSGNIYDEVLKSKRKKEKLFERHARATGETERIDLSCNDPRNIKELLVQLCFLVKARHVL